MNPLHELALKAAANYFRAEADLLTVLQRIEDERAFRDLGYTSLFAYAVGALKLPEGTAYTFITVARKAREVPALRAAIDTSGLSVGKARRIVPILTLENQEEWIEKAKTLSQNKLEKEVARFSPAETVPERAKYVTETRLLLSLGVSEKLLEKLKRIQDLESQRKRGAANLEAALEAAVDAYLERNDPLEKAKRARPVRLVSRQVSPEGIRRAIPAALVHAVNVRDEARCTQIGPDGSRCSNRRWLEIHHRRPVSEGGSDELANLAMLCSEHHRSEHASRKIIPRNDSNTA